MCRWCRRSRSGCSAIATTGIRRTRSPTTPRRACASPCRPNIDVVASGIPEDGIAEPPRRRRRSKTRRARFRASRTRSTRRSRCAISASSISRMTRVDAATVALDIVPAAGRAARHARHVHAGAADHSLNAAIAIPPVGARNTVQLDGRRQRRQESRGREALGTAAESLRLYSRIDRRRAVRRDHAGDGRRRAAGRPRARLFRDAQQPAAGRAVQLAQRSRRRSRASPSSSWRTSWRTSGSARRSGWKNYHEQWLSEGFAQYFAALYARERRGEGAFRDVLRQFRRWAIDDSDQGPVYLGYRLGHIKGESRVFRALVYNKGAAVLHMLRRLVGDEAFFAGLRASTPTTASRRPAPTTCARRWKPRAAATSSASSSAGSTTTASRACATARPWKGQELVVRFEQVGEVFDVPVTVDRDLHRRQDRRVTS